MQGGCIRSVLYPLVKMQYSGQRTGLRSAIMAFMKEEKAKQQSATDLVCEMEVDPEEARAEGLVSEYEGKAYYFCCAMCKESFDEDPGEYVK